MAYSREEAGRLQNNYIGPEHLMLGILRNGEGMAIQVLEDFDVDLQALKENIDCIFVRCRSHMKVRVNS